MTSMLIIDTTTRGLAVFTANVTRAATGLVVRPGLELPGLGLLAKGSSCQPKDSGGLPVLLIGDGYQARSSAGFVAVTGAIPWQTHPVVGWLGDHGLRVIRPRTARLLGPVSIVEDKASTNSNANTADAVMAGLPLLAATDPRAILIAEGQSDKVSVYRLLPVDPRAEAIASFDLNEVEEEHRAERFEPEAVAASWLRNAYRAHKRQRVLAPLSCARSSVLESAKKVGNTELNELLKTHLSRGFWQTARASTWEVQVIGEAPREGCAVDETVRAVPFTMAQMRAMDELVTAGRQEEANELWKQSAVDLDLPVETWEREFLGLEPVLEAQERPVAPSKLCPEGHLDWECELAGCVHSPRKEGAES